MVKEHITVIHETLKQNKQHFRSFVMFRGSLYAVSSNMTPVW